LEPEKIGLTGVYPIKGPWPQGKRGKEEAIIYDIEKWRRKESRLMDKTQGKVLKLNGE